MKAHPAKRLITLLLALSITLPWAWAEEARASPFPDVAPDAWYAQAVAAAAELGLMEGKGDGSFDPLGELTLAEAATLAAKTRSAHDGGGFTPGGDPWFQNAVDYCVERGICSYGAFAGYLIPVGYADYSIFLRPATRAEAAGLLASALPVDLYPRINRVPELPDVSYETPYADQIYLLCGAGVLTGDETGAFRPEAAVTRAETAAILVRMARPETRMELTPAADASKALALSRDGSFQVTLPLEGWRQFPHSDGSFIELDLASLDRGAAFFVLRYGKADYPAYSTPEAYLPYYLRAVLLNDPEMEQLTEPAPTLCRGLAGVGCGTSRAGDGEDTFYQVYCVENTSSFYILVLAEKESIAADERAGLQRLLYSFDLAL